MAEVICTKTFSGKHTLELVHGDITLETTEAIVNAANSQLIHGGGVAGAILRSGGLVIQQESTLWVRQNGLVTREKPAVTSAGNLPCKMVIHAVGPVWGEGDEIAKLQETLEGIFYTAETLKVQSLSIPAISTGIFGFPVELAAPMFYQSIQEYLTATPGSGIKLIRITIIDTPTLEIFEKYFPENK